jgi:hypothetical protein
MGGQYALEHLVDDVGASVDQLLCRMLNHCAASHPANLFPTATALVSGFVRRTIAQHGADISELPSKQS